MVNILIKRGLRLLSALFTYGEIIYIVSQRYRLRRKNIAPIAFLPQAFFMCTVKRQTVSLINVLTVL